MRGAQSRRWPGRGRARQGHDRNCGQGRCAEPVSCSAFCHAWPACGRGGAARPRTRRARAGAVPARTADRAGRWPAHSLGGGGTEARCRLGGAVGLQYRWRRGGRCGSAVWSCAGVPLCRRPRPARLALARRVLCRDHADEPHLRRDGQIRVGRPSGSVAACHARAAKRRKAPLDRPSLRMGAVCGRRGRGGCCLRRERHHP